MLEQGTFIGDRYEVIEKIGSGGMADVYRAKDHKLNRFIAIKVMKSEFQEDQSFVSKFRAEAHAAAGLSHPNIVNVYDVGDEKGVYYIVMELVGGITLKDYINKKGKLSVREAVSIAIQVSMGLEAAHNNNIIHRDIKPQNIMISTDGKVKVTDFGIARAASANTISSNVMGSVHYSSPEQARGGYSDVKSDIYSLGITMYEMVTGRVPFDGETTVAIAIKHLQEEMVAPSAYAPDIPYSVEQIIFKCTQKSSDRRYASIDELLRDLKLSLVNPEGDFVQLTPLNNHAKTVMISREELEQIKNQKSHGSEYDDDDDYEEEKSRSRRNSKRKNKYDDEAYDKGDDDEDDDEDDDGDEKFNPKLEKAMMTGAIIIIVVILVIFLALVGYAVGFFDFLGSNKTKDDATQTETVTAEITESETQTVTVPSLLRKTYEEAKAELNALGLGIKLASNSPQNSDEYADGMIMDQDVAAGTKVNAHTQISVVISSGTASISIPNVSGMSKNAATAAIENLGLTVKYEYEYSSDVNKGDVIRQNPVATVGVVAGDTVTITISEGIEYITVPNVVGYNQSSAETALGTKKLVAKVTEEFNSAENGTVFRQSPSAGTTLEAGQEVTIYVSKGQQYSLSILIEQPSAYSNGPVVVEFVQGAYRRTLADWTEASNGFFPFSVSGVITESTENASIIITERIYDNPDRSGASNDIPIYTRNLTSSDFTVISQ